MIEIVEAKSAPLYHGTSFRNAWLIIKSDKLIANKSNETETYGVSFTRNKSEAYSEVYIQVDQEKLSYNYKIHPVYRDGIAGRDLAEERVDRSINNIRRYITEVGINHPIFLKRLRNSMTHAQMDGTSPDNNDYMFCMKLIEQCNKYNIPMNDTLVQAEKYINMFYNDEPDQEQIDRIMKRRNRK